MSDTEMKRIVKGHIERLQQRLYNQKDDPRDWERIKKELDTFFGSKGYDSRDKSK